MTRGAESTVERSAELRGGTLGHLGVCRPVPTDGAVPWLGTIRRKYSTADGRGSLTNEEVNDLSNGFRRDRV
jgi:hypothetical protein